MTHPRRLYFVSKVVRGDLLHAWRLHGENSVTESSFYHSEIAMFRDVITTLKQDLRDESKTFIDADSIVKELVLKASRELYPDLSLEEALEEQGVTVVKADDWQDRGHGDWTTIQPGMH